MVFLYDWVIIGTIAILASLCSADVVQYIIYPVADISSENVKALESLLGSLAGGESHVYASLRFDQSTPAYWLVKLSESAFVRAEASPSVRLIRPNKPVAKISSVNSSIKITDTLAADAAKYETQPNPTATELVVLSQPSDASYTIDDYQNYVWKAALRETFIYHAEFGINMAHKDFQGRPGKIEWLYTNLTKDMGLDQKKEVIVAGGHSTCTASKAGGMLYGASKSATLVVVKMPDLSEGSIGEILATILHDIEFKGRHARCVVSISWVSSLPVDPSVPIPDPWTSIREDIVTLMMRGVIVVCAAGNEAEELNASGQKRLLIDTYPAAFTSIIRFKTAGRLIPVSNCDIYGREAPSSQKISLQPLFAPGVDIKCAHSTAEEGFRIDSGTSFSAPLVAGVIANLLASGDMIYEIPPMQLLPSWKRKGGQNVIWDLVDIAHNPPEPWNAIGNLSLFNMTAMTLQDRLTE